jgi:hypothetical protein
MYTRISFLFPPILDLYLAGFDGGGDNVPITAFDGLASVLFSDELFFGRHRYVYVWDYLVLTG